MTDFATAMDRVEAHKRDCVCCRNTARLFDEAMEAGASRERLQDIHLGHCAVGLRLLEEFHAALGVPV